jgi:hypothetical protein
VAKERLHPLAATVLDFALLAGAFIPMAGDNSSRGLILAQLQALKQRALTRHAVKHRGVKPPPKKRHAPRRRASKRRASKHCALACCAPEPSELESFLFPILEQLTEDITSKRSKFFP